MTTGLFLPAGTTDTHVADGHFVDLYLGVPATGTQPLQSQQVNVAAPALAFTVDPALAYTLVVRGPPSFATTFTPD